VYFCKQVKRRWEALFKKICMQMYGNICDLVNVVTNSASNWNYFLAALEWNWFFI